MRKFGQAKSWEKSKPEMEFRPTKADSISNNVSIIQLFSQQKRRGFNIQSAKLPGAPKDFGVYSEDLGWFKHYFLLVKYCSGENLIDYLGTSEK